MSLNKEKSIFAGEMWEQTVDGLPAPVILPPLTGAGIFIAIIYR